MHKVLPTSRRQRDPIAQREAPRSCPLTLDGLSERKNQQVEIALNRSQSQTHQPARPLAFQADENEDEDEDLPGLGGDTEDAFAGNFDGRNRDDQDRRGSDRFQRRGNGDRGRGRGRGRDRFQSGRADFGRQLVHCWSYITVDAGQKGNPALAAMFNDVKGPHHNW